MKNVFGARLCLAVLLLGLISHRVVGEVQVFQALHDATLESCNDSRGPSKKKCKKFLARLVKEIVLTTLSLAIEALAKSDKRSYDVPHERIKEIHVYLQEIFIAQGREFPKNLSEDGVHELFDMLFGFYAEKLGELQEAVKAQALHRYNALFHDECYVHPRSVADFEECTQIAMAAVARLGDTRYSWSAVWRFVKLIADIGELLTEHPSDSCDGRKEFIERMAVLIDDLCEFLSYDNLLASFEKLSTFLQKLNEKTKRQEFLHAVLESSREGALFLDELFSSLGLYMREKLSQVLSEMFSNLSE